MKRTLFVSLFALLVLSSDSVMTQETGQWIPPLPMQMEPLAVPYQGYSANTSQYSQSRFGGHRRNFAPIGRIPARFASASIRGGTPIPFNSGANSSNNYVYTPNYLQPMYAPVQYQPVPAAYHSPEVMPQEETSKIAPAPALEKNELPVPAAGTKTSLPIIVPPSDSKHPASIQPPVIKRPVAENGSQIPLPVIAPKGTPPLPLKSKPEPVKPNIPAIVAPKPVDEEEPVLKKREAPASVQIETPTQPEPAQETPPAPVIQEKTPDVITLPAVEEIDENQTIPSPATHDTPPIEEEDPFAM